MQPSQTVSPSSPPHQHETSAAPAGQGHGKHAKKKKNSWALLGFTLFLVLAGGMWFLYWFLYLQFHETTDDAYANGNLVGIHSAISGSVVAYYVDDTDFVKEGQILTILDESAYLLAYEKEIASLSATVLQVRQIYDNVHSTQANVESKQIAARRAKYDYENRSQLIASLAISKEDFTHAKDTLANAQSELAQAEAQRQVAIDAAGNTPLEQHPQILEQKSNVRRAYYNLQRCAIYAPASGFVAKRGVDVGEWITPSSNLLSIIPLDYVWIDANFKETQLRNMRIGQPVTVWLDIYGSKVKYTGQVLGLGFGTGSVFSIIPPQNATGNWIKIVQRIPVRISLDPEQLAKFPTRLGLSANVDVDITNQDLPRLGHAQPSKVVAATQVFEMDYAPVDKVIEEVINSQL